MRVFDCVIVNSAHDLDLLEARFLEYEDIPEITHVIAEAPVNHKGDPKDKHFLRERYDRFARWHGKWNHVEVEPHELPGKDPRVRKDALREYLAHGIHGDPDDVILHGGTDEIPAPWVVREVIAGSIPLPVAFEMRWCAYRPDRVHPGLWRGTMAQYWKYTESLSGLRDQKNSLPAITDAGTRLSMLDEDEQDHHPDGHALWDAEIDQTWPKWVHGKFPCNGE